jgi:hypothetical protein
LKDGTYKDAYIPQDDKFPVTSHLTSHLRDALIACPGNNDDSRSFMKLCVDEENKEIGRAFCFGTRIKAGDKVFAAGTGLGFEVIEEYRKEGVGADLLLMSRGEFEFGLVAGLSQMVFPIYRKLRYHLFEVPQYFKLRNSRYALKPIGSKSWSHKLSVGLHNIKLKLKDIPNHIKYIKLKNRYVIKKETIIPEWVSEMVANSGYKYMELHDREWLQWNLDYNTYGYDEDIQSFYSILDKNNKPLGFFMTKERINKKPGQYNGSIVGTIVEWESCDKSVLSESDINLLAIYSFSKNIDTIFTLACESDTASQLIKMGFHERATFKVGVKERKKQFDDIGDQSLWRLRYGMTNMIIL